MALISGRVASWEHVLDPVFGDIRAPGKPVRWGIEGSGLSWWTDHGIRRPPWSREMPRPIIVAAGDSFTEAIQVDDDEVYTTLVEERLARRGRPATILNAGQSSRSAADYVALAPAFRSLFAVDWVVVQISANDVLDDAWDPSKVHFVADPATGGLRTAGRPVPPLEERNFVNRAVFLASNWCALAQFTALRVNEFLMWWRSEPPLFGASGPKTAQAGTPRDFPVELGLDALVEAYQGRVTLFLLNKYDPLGTSRYAETERRIERHARKLGISFVRFGDGFADFAGTGRSPYGFPNSRYNQGHLNADGHRLAARLLTDELEKVMDERDLH